MGESATSEGTDLEGGSLKRKPPGTLIVLAIMALCWFTAFFWERYQYMVPRSGFVVTKPNLKLGKEVKLAADQQFSTTARPCMCVVPRWAKVVPSSFEVRSPSGVRAYVSFRKQMMDPDLAAFAIRMTKTSPGFDHGRVYAGDWIGFRTPEPYNSVWEHKAVSCRNYIVENLRYSVDIMMSWPRGKPKAEHEAEQIAAYILHSIKEIPSPKKKAPPLSSKTRKTD